MPDLLEIDISLISYKNPKHQKVITSHSQEDQSHSIEGYVGVASFHWVQSGAKDGSEVRQ